MGLAHPVLTGRRPSRSGDSTPILARTLPFAAYVGFFPVAAMLQRAATMFPSATATVRAATPWLYPLKTVIASALLVAYWRRYDELRPVSERRTDLAFALLIGSAVYAAWVRLDQPWARLGESVGYDPFVAGPVLGTILAAIRLFGAVVVVPVMEEVFWRSFVLRSLVSTRFEEVRLGTFTPFSFAATVVLFGLEHELVVAGMVAGTAYTLLLYRTRRLWPSIVAHATTNLFLAAHVLVTQQWKWW